MAKIWMRLCFFVLFLGLTIAQNDKVDEDYDDAWFKDYDDQWDQEQLSKLETDESDFQTEEDPDEEKTNYDKDYQIEDNRYLSEEDEDDEYNLEDIPEISKEVPLSKYEQNIIKETEDLIKKTNSKMEISNENTNTGEIDTKVDSVDNEEIPLDKYELEIMKETVNLIQKTDSNMEISNENTNKDEKDTNNDKKDMDYSKSDSNEDAAINDLLDLIESIRKLKENDENNTVDDSDDTNEVLDYEDKFSRPFHEGVILQQRINNDEDIGSASVDDKKSAEVADEVNKEQIDNNKEKNEQVEQIIPYGDDGLDASKEEASLKLVDKSNAQKEKETAPLINAEKDKNNFVELTKTPIDVDHTSSNLINLISKSRVEIFASEENDVDSVNIPINYNENIPILSPKYPDSYPNINKIYDYILEGEGLGVELNITEININGAANDFLLIVPGGTSEKMAGGIIFSYNLNQERLFRFTEVDRLFVRFRSHATNGSPADLRWAISARLLGPRPLPPKPAPDPEPVPPTARYTYTVFFGGVTPLDFKDIREQFLDILSQMVTLYVKEMDIDPGVMAINEIVNVTRVAVCNINWPDFDNCAAVTFAAPLLNDDPDAEHRLNAEDLEAMWEYSKESPFADKLSDLGLTVFSIPNDGWALTLWLTIGTACLIVAAGLAYAIWRWSCFEDYSKMPEYSDTDSSYSQKKQDLSLYPTPYQDLPALYADHYDGDHKYPSDDVTRVDMGFSNKGFARDPHFFSADYSGEEPKNSMRSDINSSEIYAQPPFYSARN